MKISITFDIDANFSALQNYTDQYLVALWHIAQANPADPFTDPRAGEFAEMIGREIIRRFLRATSPPLWEHQGGHFNWGKVHLDNAKQAEPPPDGVAPSSAPRADLPY